MRLCFGTFASILCSYKGSNVKNPKLVGTMTQTVDPYCGYCDNPQAVSKLLHCKQNLSDGRRRREEDLPVSDVKKEAQNANRDDVVLKFKNTVVRLLNKEKIRQILLTLCDLIRDDSTLDAENKEKFGQYLGMTKNELFKLCEFELKERELSKQKIIKPENITSMFPNILAGIFLYTVIAVKNRVGEECIKNIDSYIKRYSENGGAQYSNAGINSLPKIDTLPFVKNKYFYGRSALIKQISDTFAYGNIDTHITQMIYGLDGVGKTQLVLEYSHIKLNEDKYDAICWIDCADKDAVEKSCCYFLSKIGETAVLDAISRLTLWLQTNNNWLLVLDNVNDDALIERLIPKSGKEHILVTAQQNKDFIVKASTIKLDCMNKDEAVEFLVKRTNIDDRKNAEFIAERLGCFPLALEQAAAYICGAKINFNKFLELINEYELKLFDSKYYVGRNEKTIHTVLNITLDRLSDDSKQLLYCFAYMSADSVELNWLTEYVRNLKAGQDETDKFVPEIKDGKHTGKQINISKILRNFDIESKFSPQVIEVLTNELALIKVLTELEDYSLITPKIDNSFTMHVLWQEVIRYCLANFYDPTYLLSVWEVLQARCNYTDKIYDDYRIELFLPQAESLIRNIETFFEYHDELAKHINKDKPYKTGIDMALLKFQFYSFVAQYYTLRGDDERDDCIYEEADKYYSKACELALLLFGGGENDVVSSDASFTVIQEKHRRMRLNLILEHNDVAVNIYEEVKKVLINSITANAGKVEQAFINYAELWSVFGFPATAKEAYELALTCGIKQHEEMLLTTLKGFFLNEPLVSVVLEDEL